jgi:glycosyltransferase involved in cell wall biosynthesis
MRIVTVTWSFPERSEPFVLEKLLALADRGHDVHLFAEPSGQAPDERAREAANRLTVHWLPGWGKRRWPDPGVAPALASAIARDAGFVRNVARALRAGGGTRTDFWVQLGRMLPFAGLHPEVVHFEWASGAVPFLPVMPLLDCPKVVSCHGSDLQVTPLRSSWIREGLPQLFASVDRVHCVSQELAARAVDYGARPDQLVVGPMGVDTGYFVPAGARRPVDDGVVRIVSAGRLHWTKGYEFALQAVHRLRQRGHPVLYTIAGGDDGGGGEVRLTRRDLGLEGVVSLVGHLDRAALRAAFADADVFLLSSVSEGVSVAALEAMASGLPAVITDVGGMRDAVVEGDHGMLVPPRDAVALADAVERLILDSAARRTAGQRAADHAHDHFDLNPQVDRLVAVYEDLVARARPHAAAQAAAGTGEAAQVEKSLEAELVSVVMPVRDAAGTIDAQLRALETQDYEGPWEVVVADNGSRDDTPARVAAWTGRLPGLRVVDAADRGGVAHARNVGVQSARGSRVVMCDADDVVSPCWLRLMAIALERHPLVVGQLERRRLNPQHPGVWSGRPEVELNTRVAERHRTMVPGGVAGFRREVFDRVGGFDAALDRGEDIDFGWRAIRAAYSPHFVPGAVVHYRARRTLREVARQAFADGAAGPRLFARHRHDGMPRSTVREALREYGRLLRAVPGAVARREARYPLVYDAAQCAGRLAGSLRHRSLFL